MGAARTKRRVKELQRRKSAEIAAVSIQRVARGRAARIAAEAKVARREVRGRGGRQKHGTWYTFMYLAVIYSVCSGSIGEYLWGKAAAESMEFARE